MFSNWQASTISHNSSSRSHRLASSARQADGLSPKPTSFINSEWGFHTSLNLAFTNSTTMNPYLESNFLVRLMEEMEEEEEELELARHMLIRRRRACNERHHGGSIPGRVRIHRDHMSSDARIRADYFGEQPMYTDAQFRRRYFKCPHSICHVHIFMTPIMTH
jgi:hypothetical protein